MRSGAQPSYHIYLFSNTVYKKTAILNLAFSRTLYVLYISIVGLHFGFLARLRQNIAKLRLLTLPYLSVRPPVITNKELLKRFSRNFVLETFT
jgi:hypothetical protein